MLQMVARSLPNIVLILADVAFSNINPFASENESWSPEFEGENCMTGRPIIVRCIIWQVHSSKRCGNFAGGTAIETDG